MKRSFFKVLFLGLALSTGIIATSCKGKSKDATNETTTTATTPADQPAAVEIAADDAIKAGVTDATKDFPGVNASVNNGEITLTGDIQRSRLPTLMQSLNTLKAKKINNNLNIK